MRAASLLAIGAPHSAVAGVEFCGRQGLELAGQPERSWLDSIEIHPGDVDDLLHHVGSIWLEGVVERP